MSKTPLDVRRDVDEVVINLRDQECFPSSRDQIVAGLRGTSILGTIHRAGEAPVHYTKTLPTTILYEEKGIDLYDAITRDAGYYLYREELSIIEKHGDAMVAAILGLGGDAVRAPTDAKETSTKPDCSHTLLVDLGAGRLDKAESLLRSAARVMSSASATKNVSATYCAVDIQHTALTHRISELALANPSFQPGRHREPPAQRNGKLALRGVCGTYTDALGVLATDRLMQDTAPLEREGDAATTTTTTTTQRKCLLWLGSSMSNATPADAATALAHFASPRILRPGDTLLVGLDRCRSTPKVEAAYSSRSPCWTAYIRNGVMNAGAALGRDAARYLDGSDAWEYVPHWVPDEGRHMRFVKRKEACSFEVEEATQGAASRAAKRVDIAAGELVLVAQSYKYTTEDILGIFDAAQLVLVKEWSNEDGDGSVYLLERRTSGTSAPINGGR